MPDITPEINIPNTIQTLLNVFFQSFKNMCITPSEQFQPSEVKSNNA